jgi:ribosomal protein S12 methylthiotransferase RimO
MTALTTPASTAASHPGDASAAGPGEPAVALITLGCARNDVDSEELAGRLESGGFRVVGEPADADAVLVNTCGFIETAKKDSVDTLLAAASMDAPGDGRERAVVAVGCLAQRYGTELADALPEAAAVLGFDDYPDIAARVRGVLAGDRPSAPTPGDRRTLLPLSPVSRRSSPAPSQAHSRAPSRPATGPEDLPAGLAPASGPPVVRRRLDNGPMAPLKLASGCDRRCSFCAIPAFRGAFVSRPPAEVLDEAAWLGAHGVRELFLVSENTTSYGKDLADLRLLERLLPQLAAVEGISRVRCSYLQPAETRPGLLDAVAGTPGVVPYFDLSFQHASASVLRRMRRFGDSERFLGLLDEVRRRAPLAGVRSNVIVGFPGETEQDVDVLAEFLTAARLDVVGVFGYSDEDGTEGATLDGHLDTDEISARVEHLSGLVDELVAQRAEDRIGERVDVLVERAGQSDGDVEGRAEHQGPEVDGVTALVGRDGRPAAHVAVGDIVAATVVSSVGPDLVATTGAAA